jgi:hypothetical protein
VRWRTANWCRNADAAEKADEDERDHAGHHRSGQPKVNVDEADGVNRRHTSTPRSRPSRRWPTASGTESISRRPSTSTAAASTSTRLPTEKPDEPEMEATRGPVFEARPETRPSQRPTTGLVVYGNAEALSGIRGGTSAPINAGGYRSPGRSERPAALSQEKAEPGCRGSHEETSSLANANCLVQPATSDVVAVEPAPMAFFAPRASVQIRTSAGHEHRPDAGGEEHGKALHRSSRPWPAGTTRDRGSSHAESAGGTL